MEKQKFRYGDKFKIVCDIDEEILQYPCIRLMIQPLVENAIYHGLETKVEKGIIEIQGFIEKNEICIRIIDDGVGIEEQQLEHLREILKTRQSLASSNAKSIMGIGIVNVNARIKLY